MANDDMLKVDPNEYLANGYIDANTEGFHDYINGYCSLALAHQLRAEKIDIKRLDGVTDTIELRPENLDEIRAHFDRLGSPSLVRLYEASLQWLHQPNQYAAFIEHLRRIRSNLALLK